ncbi:MAG: hypothetical protein Q4E47_02890 [Candidatus Saccharibacteria bacterium]|nr:hypothetical protein [Candidatus Saccharibacteria bacterium]
MATSILKKVKVSRMQQQMMLIVLVTSLVLGVTLVLAIYFSKVISFNGKVINAKDVSIENYYSVISSVGICEDKDHDKKYSTAELKNCNPDALDVDTLNGTLRNQVLTQMSNNYALESVARDSLGECYSEDNKRINWSEVYQSKQTEEERIKALSQMRKCSSLRVIPDALPAQLNEEALLSSLNKIFLLSEWEPEALSPGGSVTESPIVGLTVIPVSLLIEADTAHTRRIIANIERSIREFDISVATISWATDEDSNEETLKVEAQANAYYSTEKVAQEETMYIYASNAAKKKQRSSDK